MNIKPFGDVKAGWLIDTFSAYELEALKLKLSNPLTARLLSELISACDCIAGAVYCTCSSSPKGVDFAGHIPKP